MFGGFQQKYGWVLDVMEYDSLEQLKGAIEHGIIGPALMKHAELIEAKASAVRTRKASDYQGD